MGTQTLIQALQALPWADPDNDDDCWGPEQDPTGSESDDEGDHRSQYFLYVHVQLVTQTTPCPVGGLASSIHAIHRPLAHSRRHDIPGQRKHDEEPLIEEPEADFEDEEVEQDFEDPKSAQQRPLLSHQSHSLPLGNDVTDTSRSNHFKFANTRTGSLATIRLHRRTRLAEKLRDVFELDGIKEVWAGKTFLKLTYFLWGADSELRDALLAVAFCL